MIFNRQTYHQDLLNSVNRKERWLSEGAWECSEELMWKNIIFMSSCILQQNSLRWGCSRWIWWFHTKRPVGSCYTFVTSFASQELPQRTPSSVHSCCYSCHPISAVLMLQRTPSCQISWNHKMFWVEGISSLGANICCLGSRWIIHICRLKTHLVFLLSWGEHLQKKTNLELSQWLGWPQHNHQNEV